MCTDGNLATGSQTGTKGPEFNGYYFHIGEVGAAWEIGSDHLPGSFGIGLWNQTGHLRKRDVSESGAAGVYLFGSQRIWFRHPGEDNSGISGFFQFGANDSETLPMNQYFGSGLTAFGLIPGRSKDSAGAGMACSWLNGNIFDRSSELMFQAYYQAHLIGTTCTSNQRSPTSRRPARTPISMPRGQPLCESPFSFEQDWIPKERSTPTFTKREHWN